MTSAWPTSHEAHCRLPVDLFSLPAHGEIIVVASRLGHAHVVNGFAATARGLLDRLGSPPLWELLVGWDLLQASLVADQPDAAEQAATAIASVAPPSPLLAGLGQAAATWVDAL